MLAYQASLFLLLSSANAKSSSKQAHVAVEEPTGLFGSQIPGIVEDWQPGSNLLALRGRAGHPDFVYCALPKNGCTVWKQLMLRAMGSGHWNTRNGSLIHNPILSGLDLVGYSVRGGELVRNDTDFVALMGPTSTSIKAVIVRDPITRVLSSYLDRCVDQGQWFRCLTHDNASFEQVISAHERLADDAERDVHFKNQSQICGLQYQGYVHYDAVRKFEHFQHASFELLQVLDLWELYGASGWGANGSAAFGAEEQPLDNHDSEHHTEHHVCQYYSPSLLERVKRLYWPDFEEFQYVPENWIIKCSRSWQTRGFL